MKSRLIKCLLIVLAAVVWANTSLAGGTLTLPAVYNGAFPLRITICPLGDGDPLSEAWIMSTPPVKVDATLKPHCWTSTTLIPW